jgi:hypothetical protein
MSLIPLGFWNSSVPVIPTSGLKMYFNFEGEFSWYSGTVETVKDFSPSLVNGSLTGGNGWNSAAGGNMQFRSANSRFININRTANDFGLFYGSASFVFVVRLTANAMAYILNPTNARSYGNDVNIRGYFGNMYYSHNAGVEPFVNVSLNTWHHIVMTYSYADYVTKIYVNGVLQVGNGFQERMTAVDDGYWIGRDTGVYYNFDLGLFMIYNRVLTADEVSDIFNAQKGRFGL